jgi:cytoskeletal protein CcmA (bactofilin family)
VKDSENQFSMIDKGMTVDGSILGKGNLVVKGSVKGNLSSESIVVSEEGTVAADVHAHSVTIGGSFEGRLEATGQLLILASGSCSGEIVCGDLVVEAGGRLNARVICKGQHKSKKSD